MSQRRAHKRNLSSGILEMKFMKKSKEKADKLREDLESATVFAGNIENLKKLQKSDEIQFIIEHSMVPIEKMFDGRMSFKGMNPEIERLMEDEMRGIREKEKAIERLKSNEPEISDAAMARRLGKTIAKKFSTRNEDHDNSEENEDDSEEVEESPPKKAKFLKPQDD